MKLALTIAGAIFGLILLVVISFGISYKHWYDYGAATEQTLLASLDNNKNILSSTTLKVKEMAQVPDLYAADLKKVIDANFQGRYGKDGQKAVVSFMQEHNLNLEPKMYLNIQNTMEAGRNEFKTSQTELLDKKRSYETNLNSLWSGFMLRLS